MKLPDPPRWLPCTICDTFTQHALVGNRLLSRWEVNCLPAEAAPPVSWRCRHHRRCKLRAASAFWANECGDLCCTLVCGHQVQWVFRGEWAYTPEMVQRGLATGALRLDKRRRCFACGDLERARQHPGQDEAVVSEPEESSQHAWERSNLPMREPPDRLTERVMQMVSAAHTNSMTPAEVIEQLTASLRRNVTYLARRERLHPQTAYDEAGVWGVTEPCATALSVYPEMRQKPGRTKPRPGSLFHFLKG